MSTQVIPLAAKTAKPVVGGILNIVVGSLSIIGAVVMVILGTVFLPWTIDPFYNDAGIAGVILLIIAVPLLAMGAISLVGGIFGVQRRKWGWALAGSITSVLTSTMLGIAAIVLIAISKDEFAP